MKYFLDLPAELQLAAVLLKDQTPAYAEKLFAALIMELLVMVPDYIDLSTPHLFAEPLWMGSLSLGCGSCIVGCVSAAGCGASFRQRPWSRPEEAPTTEA